MGSVATVHVEYPDPVSGCSPISRHRIVLVDPVPHRAARLAAALNAEFECTSVSDLESAESAFQLAAVDLVIAEATACGRRFMQLLGEYGLSRRCLVVADEEEVDDLVDAYSVRHGLQVIRRETTDSELREAAHALLMPRSETRHPLDGVEAVLTCADGAVLRVPVLDLSNRGIAVLVAAEYGILLPDTSVKSIDLYRAGGRLCEQAGARVRYVELHEGSDAEQPPTYKVGFEFWNRPAESSASAQGRISDPVRVRATMKEAAIQGQWAMSPVQDASTPVGVRVHEYDAARNSATVTFVSNAFRIEVGDVLECSFELTGVSHSLLASVLSVEAPGQFSIKGPRVIRWVRQRKTMRVRPDADNPVMIQVRSPFQGQLLTRPVLNITASGLAFEVDEVGELFPVGTSLPGIVLRFPNGSMHVCAATVRGLFRTGSAASRTAICGIEFDGISDTERARLADTIVHASKPELRDGTGAAVETLWAFFKETNFVYPEKRDGMDVPAVMTTLRTLLARPTEVFKTSLFVKDGGLQGHASAVRAYDRTWYLQHLAARTGGKARMTRGRMMNLAVIEYLEQLPGIEWVKIWYRPTNRWPARIFGSFAQRIADPEYSDLRTFDYWVRDCAPVAERLRGEQPTLATAADLIRIEAYFVMRKERVLLRSDDLASSGLTLPRVAAHYERAGLERRREVWVLKCGERVVGFSLLEISSAGLNFSELTNTFRVYSLSPDDAVRAALVRHAYSRYASLGFARCIGLGTETDQTAFERCGFRIAKQYACWTWHRSQYPQFCEHILRLKV